MVKEKKHNTMNPTRLLNLARISLIALAIAILLASFFFYHPSYDPMSFGINPQLAQTLSYGGVVLFISLFSGRWSTFGGIIAILYGGYKILGHPFNLFNHNPFTRDLLTLVPIPAYHTLYGLFITSGILCIIGGLMVKPIPMEETSTSKQFRRMALIMTLSSLVMAGIYALGLGILLMLQILPYVPGTILGGMILLLPLLLAIIFITRKWAAQGGFLEIIIAVPLFKIPYAIFIVMFII